LKIGTASGYDFVHQEFLKNVGPKAQNWLSRFFLKVIIVNTIPIKLCPSGATNLRAAVAKHGKVILDPDPDPVER